VEELGYPQRAVLFVNNLTPPLEALSETERLQHAIVKQIADGVPTCGREGLGDDPFD
jgi:hypothetical protein